jgi:hypothetical protein
MAMFCRHNRMTARCPICSREQEAEPRAKLPPRPPRARSGSPPGARGAGGRGAAALRTRRLERAPDDGYRHPLVPGLRASADALRLAGALGAATARLAPPGPYPVVAEQHDREDAAWLAFLLALAGPDAPDLQAAIAAAAPRWDDGVPGDLSPARARSAEAYREWAARHGSQLGALSGDPGWTPQQRFARAFDRLALPGFARAPRFDLLVTLGAAEVVAMEADGLHLGPEEDAATMAAKRVLLSGDRRLLDRRSRALAAECGVPLAALDRALAEWERGGGDPDQAPAATARALGL